MKMKPHLHQHQVECGLVPDVEVRQGAAVVQLVAVEDQPLLERWNPFLCVEFGLDLFDAIACFHV